MATADTRRTVRGTPPFHGAIAIWPPFLVLRLKTSYRNTYTVIGPPYLHISIRLVTRRIHP